VRRLPLIALLLACTACGSAAPAPSTGGGQVVAQVGSTAIGNDLFQVRLTSALAPLTQAGGPSDNAAMHSRVRASVLRSLIIDAVIAQEAAASGVTATDAEIQAQVQADVSAAGGTSQLKSRLASLGGSMAQLHDEILSSLNEQKLEDLFAHQRATEIEQKLGVRVTTMAFPAGIYGPRDVGLVREAGYRGALTTTSGVNHGGEPMETLLRTMFMTGDTLEDFKAKMNGVLDQPSLLEQVIRSRRARTIAEVRHPRPRESRPGRPR